ncbi:MAG TPA: arginine deiminase family protein [Pyrinomonadaceae bacterium]|nr:arginine deiminase family protein [Pyrinomonadaceae bacterium]
MRFTKAIVRPPAANFSEGLTTAVLGRPNFEIAVAQHDAYCRALQGCGLDLTRLNPDPDYPDSTFVEDAAVLTERTFVIARPGAVSRRGEITAIRATLANLPSSSVSLAAIDAPGTLDGGDVCEAGDQLFIGISERTNEAGAQQLADLLAPFGYRSTFVDIRQTKALLHLKSGLAYLGGNQLVISKALSDREEFVDYELVRVPAGEEYAANCIRVNDVVMIAAGFADFEARLRKLGYQTIALNVSEFQKMDGGLSCLSLRF